MHLETSRRSDGKLFIAGEYVDATGGFTDVVEEKATGREIGRCALASESDVDAAVASALVASDAWAATPAAERAALLRRCADLLDERASAFEEMLMWETGGVRAKARGEIGAARARLHHAASLPLHATGDLLQPPKPGKLTLLERIPVGVVAAIAPWNFPLVLAMRAIAPSIALGNTVVLKPASLTPIAAGQMLVELFADAGAPAGVLNLVTGSGSTVGLRLASHPDVALVHFTGSTEVGRQIAEIAGRQLKRTVLELGGDNALVVLDDADVEHAASAGAWAAFEFQGQTCISASRHIVMRAVAERYTEALARRARALTVGDPASDDVQLGPLISAAQRDRVHDEIVGASVAMGARVVEGGTCDGLFYRPTVLVGVTAEMPAFREEIFGPIAPITVVDSEEEALALTNRERALVNAVFTGDPMRGLAFAERVRSGMVHVNDAMGRPTGEADIDELTTRRWIGVQRSPLAYPYG